MVLLCDGRLVKLSPLTITHELAHPYHLVYPPALQDWPPLTMLRQWLHDELEMSRETLHPTPRPAPTKARRRPPGEVGGRVRSG